MTRFWARSCSTFPYRTSTSPSNSPVSTWARLTSASRAWTRRWSRPRRTKPTPCRSPRPRPPVSTLGDLWVLGHHRLLCASALEAESYATLIGEERAAIVFTDPPYNVRVRGHFSGLGAIQHREFAMASGEMSEAEFATFLSGALKLLARYSVDGSLHFICMDWRHMREQLAAGDSAYTELLYRSQHELVFVYKRGSASHRNNVQLGRHGRNRSNVWRYPGVNSFNRALLPAFEPRCGVRRGMAHRRARDLAVRLQFGQPEDDHQSATAASEVAARIGGATGLASGPQSGAGDYLRQLRCGAIREVLSRVPVGDGKQLV